MTLVATSSQDIVVKYNFASKTSARRSPVFAKGGESQYQCSYLMLRHPGQCSERPSIQGSTTVPSETGESNISTWWSLSSTAMAEIVQNGVFCIIYKDY